jgi:6-phosphogluconolactonase
MVFTVSYDVKIFKTSDELSEEFAQLLKNEVSSADKQFNLVLSGGSTPKHMFKYLSDNYKDQIIWSKINFFWGDERCVPPDDNQSNYKMANESLLSNVNVIEDNIFRIRGEDDPKKEANRYSEIINKTVLKKNDNKPAFDLIMLGLGEDGHTASIFPNQLDLIDDEKICAVAIPPETKQKRITLTGKIINNSKNIIFIVTGKKKSQVVADIIKNKIVAEKYPAYYIRPVNGNLYWFLDNEAASLITHNN